MKILVACEESQRVCKAFRAKGHEAYSCDIEFCSGGKPEWHIWSDVTPLLNGNCEFRTCDGQAHEVAAWDMILAFPPCTYLTKAGSCNLYRNGKIDEERFNRGQQAASFFRAIYNADCPKIRKPRADESLRAAAAQSSNISVLLRCARKQAHQSLAQRLAVSLSYKRHKAAVHFRDLSAV